MNLMTVSQIAPDDVAIFFADNAKNTEIMQLYNIAKERKAATIAVTKLGNNALTTGCDQVLFATSAEIDKKSGLNSSRFAQLYIVDTLYTAIANRDYENIKEYLKDSYDVFHKTARE